MESPKKPDPPPAAVQMVPFQHRQSAHCESGVASALATHHGRSLSEPMAFGIGSGIFFAHLPFVKVMGLPLTTFRSFPGTILTKVFRRTGIRLTKQKFRNEDRAVETLDALIARGIPAGVQLSVFWLPYLPPQFRFQFNAHHAVVCGKKDGDYLISDPIGEAMVTCPVADFRRAWFAKGPLAPHGALYSAEQDKPLPGADLAKAVTAALKESCNRMLRVPFSFFGATGISVLAKRITAWPEKLHDDRKIKLNLGQIVRMAEEIGTGGAGFRFLYAAFLQEASRLPQFSFLAAASDLMTESGDHWRAFAITNAKTCKAGDFSVARMKELSAILENCALLEEKAFRQIDRDVRRGKVVWN